MQPFTKTAQLSRQENTWGSHLPYHIFLLLLPSSHPFLHVSDFMFIPPSPFHLLFWLTTTNYYTTNPQYSQNKLVAHNLSYYVYMMCVFNKQCVASANSFEQFKQKLISFKSGKTIRVTKLIRSI